MTLTRERSSRGLERAVSARRLIRRAVSGRPIGRPEVSIIVVTWNGFRDCVRLFRSLARTRDVIYEVVVVDNRSRPPTRLLLVLLFLTRRINRLCLLDRNTMFAEGNNIGVAAASRRARLVLLLNSDVEIRDPRWLRRLIDAHQRGATSLGFIKTGPVPRADGYCLLIDRDIYERGGLDERHQWWWSVTRLQARVLRDGFLVRAVRRHNELLVHFGGGRSGSVDARGMKIKWRRIRRWFDGHRPEVVNRLSDLERGAGVTPSGSPGSSPHD